MDPDHFKEAWRSATARTRLAIDPELILREVRHNQRHFTAAIFWRDVREVGTALLLVPLWVYLGIKSTLPWTWYLMVPALLWVAGFLLVDRMRQRGQTPGPAEPLRRCVAGSLAQVEHQIGLLRRIFWWYLLPLVPPGLAFFGQVAWRERAGGWGTALAASGMVTLGGVVFAGIYVLNQAAVRSELEPRRRELEALLASLGDEPPAAAEP